MPFAIVYFFDKFRPQNYHRGMRFLLVFILIGSVLAVAGLGVAFMGDQHGVSEHGGCLANLASRAACPDGVEAAIFAAFHLNVFKTFSTAYILAILLMIVFDAWGMVAVRKNLFDYPGQTAFATADSIPLRFILISWLKLLEKRDPASEI